MIKNVNEGRQYGVVNKYIKIICYADDTILIAQDEDNLQRLTHKFNAVIMRFNITAVAQKIKMTVINKKCIRCKLGIVGVSKEHLMEIKYLDNKLSNYGYVTKKSKMKCTKLTYLFI